MDTESVTKDTLKRRGRIEPSGVDTEGWGGSCLRQLDLEIAQLIYATLLLK